MIEMVVSRPPPWAGAPARQAATALCRVAAAALVAGCAPAHWGGLPSPALGVRMAVITEDDVAVLTGVASRLIAASPLPVDRVWIASSGTIAARYHRQVAGDNAVSYRCDRGDPPPSGCVIIGDLLLTALSEEALAGVIAHELGHLERGHRDVYGIGRVGAAVAGAGLCQSYGGDPAGAVIGLVGCGLEVFGWALHLGGAAYSRAIETEADAAAVTRLAAAGFCAGKVMRQTWEEMSTMAAAQDTPSLFSTHPSFSRRWKAASEAGCGPAPPAPSPAPSPSPTLSPLGTSTCHQTYLCDTFGVCRWGAVCR